MSNAVALATAQCGELIRSIRELAAVTEIVVGDLFPRLDASKRAGLQGIHNDLSGVCAQLEYVSDTCVFQEDVFMNCAIELERLSDQGDGDAVAASISAYERVLTTYRKDFQELLPVAAVISATLDQIIYPEGAGGASLFSRLEDLIERLADTPTRTEDVLREISEAMTL